jgi:nucleoside-diphosphate-sugar epimerase
MKRKIVVVGAGWLGLQFVHYFAAQGDEVYYTTRHTKPDGGLPELVETDRRQASVAPTWFALALPCIWSPTLVPYFQDAIVICAIPVNYVHDHGQAYVAALASLADIARASKAQAIIHCSSTGVYQGLTGEVDEQLAAGPAAKAQCLWQGEQQLAGFSPCVTLRLAGLFGPNRHPAKFLSGRVCPDGGNAVNLVHSDDIIAFIAQLLRLPQLPDTRFNLCSPSHPTKQAFYGAAIRAAGLPAATFIDTTTQHHVVSSQKSLQVAGFNYRHNI